MAAIIQFFTRFVLGSLANRLLRSVNK